MYREPDTWHALMEKLTETSARYVAAKVRAGADVIQLLRLVGRRAVAVDYEEFVAPYSARILAAVDAPTIHFGTGTATLLADMASAGGDVIGLDWRIPLDRGWAEVGDERGVQGNLDPACCSRRGSESSPRPRIFSSVPEGGRVMYSTLGTECHPKQTRPFSDV
jgi:uroporphyrinogen decarboxylase